MLDLEIELEASLLVTVATAALPDWHVKVWEIFLNPCSSFKRKGKFSFEIHGVHDKTYAKALWLRLM